VATIKKNESMRGFDVSGKTEIATTGYLEFDIGELSALINFSTHVIALFWKTALIIPVVLIFES